MESTCMWAGCSELTALLKSISVNMRGNRKIIQQQPAPTIQISKEVLGTESYPIYHQAGPLHGVFVNTLDKMIL